MFQLQAVVFIAVLCTVNAAVTVNIYKDDLETVEAKVRKVESCDDAWCERTCRLLGFTSGICVGDTCKCLNHKEDDLKTIEVKVHQVESCDESWCERTCRLLGFTSGICVGDSCRCWNQKEDEQIQQNEIPSLDEDVRGNGLSGCDPNACDQLCRRLKFPSGTCVNGRCKCDNFRRQTEQIEQNDIPSLDEDVRGNGLSGCDPNACDQLCRRLKFPSGTCVNGRCKCDNFRRQTEQIEQNDIPSLDEDVRGNGLSGCDPNACDQLCRRLKFPSGTCVNGRCKCDNFRRQTEQIEQNDIPSLDEDIRGNGLSGCDPNACDQLCRRLKFPSGTCVNGRCKCDNFRRQTELIEQNEIPSLDEDVRGNGLSGCDPNACDQLCRRLKFPSGTCVNGRCKCDNFRRQTVKEDKSLRSQQSCNNVNCYFMCRRWGYIGGSCRGDLCLCV